MKIFMTWILFCSSLYILGAFSKNQVSAELPPQVYEQWKASATHVLYLIIDTIDREEEMDSGSNEFYDVDAEVVGVNRTIPGSQVMVDTDVQFFTYLITANGTTDAGPRAPVALSVGDCILAYLNVSEVQVTNSSTVGTEGRQRNWGEIALVLAAGGDSFEKLNSSSPNCRRSNTTTATPTASAKPVATPVAIPSAKPLPDVPSAPMAPLQSQAPVSSPMTPTVTNAPVNAPISPTVVTNAPTLSSDAATFDNNIYFVTSFGKILSACLGLPILLFWIF